MKKALAIALLAGFSFAACGSESSEMIDEDQATLNLAWSSLSDSDIADICFGYETYGKDEVIRFLTSEPDAMTNNLARLFYKMMGERC